jgi:hypothetical protein
MSSDGITITREDVEAAVDGGMLFVAKAALRSPGVLIRTKTASAVMYGSSLEVTLYDQGPEHSEDDVEVLESAGLKLTSTVVDSFPERITRDTRRYFEF